METIRHLRVFLIESPIKMQRQQGVGDVKGTVKRVLVELTSSSGIVGWGEAAPWEVFTGTAEAAVAALDIYLRPLVIGARVDRIRALMLQMKKALVGHGEAKLAIETAMFDILGKSAGLSIATLLGGRSAIRSRFPSP